MTSAYSKAASRGYPYSCGDGENQDGRIWLSRFARSLADRDSGKGTFLYVGYDHDNHKWVFKTETRR